MLDYLFTKSEFKDILVFKGGTSLSKSYNLINRMSEDIDLILNWKILGEAYNLDLWENDKSISKNKINKNKKEILEKTNDYLINEFTPKLSKGIKEDLGFEIKISYAYENDAVVIYVDYPKTVKDDYLLDVVKLEIGPLAALTPTKLTNIKPYCFEDFKQLFKTKEIQVITVTPERSFWEKATILHREALRPNIKSMPLRYFRHYYDLFMLGKSVYKNNALKDIQLLKAVVHFKEKFYKETWMNYEEIFDKGIRLVPDEFRYEELKKDYNKMKEMIQELVPFEDIINYLKVLEKEINEII